MTIFGFVLFRPTYCAEFLPTRIRATVMVLLEVRTVYYTYFILYFENYSVCVRACVCVWCTVFTYVCMYVCMYVCIYMYFLCVHVLTCVNSTKLYCLLQFFWAAGAILEAILAMVVMTNIDDDNVNWRWLLGLSAVPVGLLTFIFPVSINCNDRICLPGNTRE